MNTPTQYELRELGSALGAAVVLLYLAVGTALIGAVEFTLVALQIPLWITLLTATVWTAAVALAGLKLVESARRQPYRSIELQAHPFGSLNHERVTLLEELLQLQAEVEQRDIERYKRCVNQWLDRRGRGDESGPVIPQ